jgi:dolichol-phosphate mannosyltransferase
MGRQSRKSPPVGVQGTVLSANRKGGNMEHLELNQPVRLSVVIPCFNEDKTIEKCIRRVLEIQDRYLSLEIIVIDDASTDNSLPIIQSLATKHPEISVLRHNINQGKGAALRTGFRKATGDFVAVQDADLEYNPSDLRRLLVPLLNNEADVMFGSRFLSHGPHRVLYYWHYLANASLTLLSNMLSDLNLTDMESCYKVFRREIIQSIRIEENRFGFEPEIVAKVAQLRPRIYEMGISYFGRTYAEGKKIALRDGLRALYCIFHYNAPKAPMPIQFCIYLCVAAIAAAFNLMVFLCLLSPSHSVGLSASAANTSSAVVSYLLCISLLFRHNARWNSTLEIAAYTLVTGLSGFLDVLLTSVLVHAGNSPGITKALVSLLVMLPHYLGCRYWVFPESPVGPWKPQIALEREDRPVPDSH